MGKKTQHKHYAFKPSKITVSMPLASGDGYMFCSPHGATKIRLGTTKSGQPADCLVIESLGFEPLAFKLDSAREILKLTAMTLELLDESEG